LLGMVMLALGLIGEYIGRIYLEVRRRPTYIVRGIHGNGDADVAKPQAGISE
jgi:polyisoprenyl-phosphate glycosyltransferase